MVVSCGERLEGRAAAAEEQAKRTRRALKKAERQLDKATTTGSEQGSGSGKNKSSKGSKGSRSKEENDGDGGSESPKSPARSSGGGGGSRGGSSSTAAGDGARWVKVDASTAAALTG